MTFEELNKQYAEACAKAGELQFHMLKFQTDHQIIMERIKELRDQAAQLNAETKAKEEEIKQEEVKSE